MLDSNTQSDVDEVPAAPPKERTEVQQEVIDRFSKAIRITTKSEFLDNDYPIRILKEAFDLNAPENAGMIREFTPMVGDYVASLLRKKEQRSFTKTLEDWPDRDALVSIPEVQDAAEKYIAELRLSNLAKDRIDAIASIFSISRENYNNIARTELIKTLKTGHLPALGSKTVAEIRINETPDAEISGAIKEGLHLILAKPEMGKDELNSARQLCQIYPESSLFEDSIVEAREFCIDNGWIQSAKTLNNYADDMIELMTPEILERIKKGYIEYLSRGFGAYGLKPDTHPGVRVNIKQQLRELTLVTEGDVNFLKSPELEQAAIKALSSALSLGAADLAESISTNLILNESVLESPEIRSAALVCVNKNLDNYHYNAVKKTIRSFGLDEESLQNPETLAMAEKSIEKAFDYTGSGRHKQDQIFDDEASSDVVDIMKRFQIPIEIVRDKFRPFLLGKLKIGQLPKTTKSEMRELGITINEFASKETDEAVLEGVKYYVRNAKDPSELNPIFHHFDVDNTRIEEATREAVLKLLARHQFHEVARFFDGNNLYVDFSSFPECIPDAIATMIVGLNRENVEGISIIEIFEGLGSPKEISDSLEIKAAVIDHVARKADEDSSFLGNSTLISKLKLPADTKDLAIIKAFLESTEQGKFKFTNYLTLIEAPQSEKLDILKKGLIKFLLSGGEFSIRQQQPARVQFGAGDDFFQQQDLREAGLINFETLLQTFHHETAAESVAIFNFSTEELQPIAEKAAIKMILDGKDHCLSIIEAYNIDIDAQDVPRETLVREGVAAAFEKTNVSDALEIVSKLLPESTDEINNLFYDHAIALAKSGEFEDLVEVANFLIGKPQEIFDSPEIIAAIKEGLESFQAEDWGSEIMPFIRNLQRMPFDPADMLNFKKTAVIYMLSARNDPDLYEAISELDLPTEAFRDPEITLLSIRILTNDYGDVEGDNFSMSIPDFSYYAIEMCHIPFDEVSGLIDNKKYSHKNRLGLCIQYPGMLDDKIKELFPLFLEELPAEVRENYDTLAGLVGPIKLRDICSDNKDFITNPHDYLLFVEILSRLTPEKQALMNEIVLRNCFNRLTDTSVLNEHLQSFDLNHYLEKNNGVPVPFQNIGELVREAEMMRFGIEIPEDTSDQFRQTLEHLLKIKGVDIPFIKMMIDGYKDKPIFTSSWDDDDIDYSPGDREFASRLIDIIERAEDFDDSKMIKPWSETFPLDPLYRVVYNAVGLHSQNQFTPRYAEYLSEGAELDTLCRYFAEIDRDRSAKTNVLFEKKIEANPMKRDQLIAERDRETRKQKFLSQNAGNQPEKINLGELSELAFKFSEKESEDITGLLRNALENPELRKTLVAQLIDFDGKSNNIREMIELSQFESLFENANMITKMFDERKARFQHLFAKGGQENPTKEQLSAIREQAIKNFTVDEVVEAFAGKELSLVAFVLYFAINNRKRQQESKNLKNSLDQILRQSKYVQQNNALKEKGIVEAKNDPFVSYVQGKLPIDPEDNEKIREVLNQAGMATVGRQMKAEIASGSDATAWTCGDQTNCCMPFTSPKNKEYLLREDLSYFVVRVLSPEGDENIVAQSVLVSAIDKKQPDKSFVSLDNIEVANRAIHLRPIIAEAYQKLKMELINRYEIDDRKLHLSIGTSNNDDGGTVTGSLCLVPRTAEPAKGEMVYSDWARHESEYLLYDTDDKNNNDAVTLYGLQKDLLAASKVRSIIKTKEEYEEIENILDKIAQGEDDDDGDGGMTFPDNYSAVIAEKGNVCGYVLAADYLLADYDEEDTVTIEKISFVDSVSQTNKEFLLYDYLKKRQIVGVSDPIAFSVSSKCMAANPWVSNVVEQVAIENASLPTSERREIEEEFYDDEEEDEEDEDDDININDIHLSDIDFDDNTPTQIPQDRINIHED